MINTGDMHHFKKGMLNKNRRETGRIAPLISHCGGYTRISAGAFLPAVRRWSNTVYPRGTTRNNVCWPEARKVLEPEKRGFCLSVAKLPRLNPLIGFAEPGRQNRNRIFKANAQNWSCKKTASKNNCLVLFSYF